MLDAGISTLPNTPRLISTRFAPPPSRERTMSITKESNMSRLNNTPQHAPHRLRWVGHLVTFLPALITVLQAYGILTGEQVNAWVALAITVLRVWLQQRATQKSRTDNSPSCSEQRGKR